MKRLPALGLAVFALAAAAVPTQSIAADRQAPVASAPTRLAQSTSPYSPPPEEAMGKSFETFALDSGATLEVGLLGPQAGLKAAIGATLRRIVADLNSRPTVTEATVDESGGSAAFFFSASRKGAAVSGLALAQVRDAGQASAVIILDDPSRFAEDLPSALRQARDLLDPDHPKGGAVKPAEPLTPRAFPDGTGEISLPADWTLDSAATGQVHAHGPTSEIVVWNFSLYGVVPNSQGARYASPVLRPVVMPYPADAVVAWQTVLPERARQLALPYIPTISVSEASRSNVGASHFAQIVGEADFPGANVNPGDVRGTYIAFVQTTPPDLIGQWNMYFSFAFVPKSRFADAAETTAAVFASVRINFAAVQQQADAIRKIFQERFEAMIANLKEQDAERAARTQAALAQDRAAQEEMHKRTVAICNEVLDRTTIEDATTGRHGTIESWFADALIKADPRYRRVPPHELIAGIDY